MEPNMIVRERMAVATEMQDQLFVKALHVQNFKGFAELNIEFSKMCTIIIGDNGFGKTSILDALAIGVGVRQTSLSGGQKYQRPIDKANEVRNVVTQFQSVDPQLPCKVIVKMDEPEKGEVVVGRVIGEDNKADIYYSRKALRDHYRQIFAQVRKGETTELPLISFHSVYRLMELDNRIVQKTKVTYATQGSRLEGYDDCFSSKSSSKYFLSWYKTLKETSGQNDMDACFLEVFKECLLSCLADWRDFYYSPKMDDFVFVDKNGTAVQLHQMSTGYRTMTGLVADLIYRCIKLNPQFGREAVARTRGLVMIDEIDLHLHPSWQRRIVSELHRCFPRIQFVVTTHSPMIVLGASEEAQIVKLSGNGVVQDHDFDVKNYDMSLLLQSHLFDSVAPHSPVWDEKIPERRRLLLKQQPTGDEKERLKQLDRELAVLSLGESEDEYKTRLLINKIAEQLHLEP